jgi:N-acetylglucosamine kinase-like BadF-type ATPase
LAEELVLALEGGGTRSQAALLDGAGNILCVQDSAAVNTNFVALAQARQTLIGLVEAVLQAGGVHGAQVSHFVTSLVGAPFGSETFGLTCPCAKFLDFPELRVVFARAGIYHPHGVGLVAATGATVWGVREDDGREVVLGGWGSLLGDEGSAYAMGLQGLRAAVRAYENRASAPTSLAEAVCAHFDLSYEQFREQLIQLVYQKPLSRAEIAATAPLVTRLAEQGDPLALRISEKTAGDLAALVLSAARRLFEADERFDVVMAGGMVNAGEVVLAPLQQKLRENFPGIRFTTGTEAPALALGRLALILK